MNERNIFKNFSYILIGRVVAAALQGFFYLFFAFLLDPSEYGQISYLIAIAGTFSIIFRFGLPYTVTVNQAKKNQIMANQVNVLALITTGAAAIILLFIDPFVAFLCLGWNLFIMTQQNLLGLKKYKKHMWNSIAKGILTILISISLYFIFELPGIVLGMAISTAVLSSYFLKSLRRNVFSFKDVRANFKVLVHNFGFDIGLNLPRMIDKIVIVPLLGFTLTGIYQFNLQILFLLEIFPIALYSFLLSEESSGIKNRKIYLVAIIGSILLSLSAIFLAPPFQIPRRYSSFTNYGYFINTTHSFSNV